MPADLAAGRAAGLTDALIDRLTLDAERVQAMADGVRTIVELDDPVGEELEARTLYNGLELRKVRVPLGVVAIVYEARPERDRRRGRARDQVRQRRGVARILDGRALERGARCDRGRGRGAGGAARGHGLADRWRRPRGARRAGAPGPLRRSDHPAGRRRAQERIEGRRHGAGDLCRRGQLPRLRRLRRRRRDGAADRLQREGAAARCLQLRGDAAGARRRRSPGAARTDGEAAATPAWSCASMRARARLPGPAATA